MTREIMPQNNSRIQGKFYPLQNREWVECCKTLTKSQLSVLYYLRSIDPYSNGVRIKASKIASELGISRKAVYEAISVLQEKNYINLDDVEYSIKLSAGGCLCDTSSTDTQLLPVSEYCHSQVTQFTSSLQHSPPSNNIHSQVTQLTSSLQVQPESLEVQASQFSKINKDYLDFIQTLSESERVNFWEFCEEKTKNLSQEVNDIEAWLAHKNKAGRNRWEVYYKKFSETQKRAVKESETRCMSPLEQLRQEFEEQRQQAERLWHESQAKAGGVSDRDWVEAGDKT